VVNDHFGSAPYFTLYDDQSGDVTVVTNQTAQHRHGHCKPLKQLNDFELDCVVCSGMGRRAIEKLGRKGIKVYLSSAGPVRDVVAGLDSGSLPEIDPAQACAGHDGGHGHHHGHGRHHGQGQQQGRGKHKGHGHGCRSRSLVDLQAEAPGPGAADEIVTDDDAATPKTD